MSGYQLIQEAKKNAGIESDYSMAERMGVSAQLMSNWKNGRSMPDGINTLKICEIGNIDPTKGLKLMQGGYAQIWMSVGLTLLFTVILILSAIPSQATTGFSAGFGNVYYVK